MLLLAHGKEWREALRVAYGNGRPDLVDTVVAAQAAQAAAAALEGENVAGARRGRVQGGRGPTGQPKCTCTRAHTPTPPADINDNIDRVAKYRQRLAQLRERRAAMEVG